MDFSVSCDSFFPLVPSAAPIFTITAVSATGFTVSWQTLPPCEQNGRITVYTISVTRGGGGLSVLTVYTNALLTSFTIPSLTPFTTYGVRMAASTVVGQGAFSSEVTIRTNESGMCLCRHRLLDDGSLTSLMQREQ